MKRIYTMIVDGWNINTKLYKCNLVFSFKEEKSEDSAKLPMEYRSKGPCKTANGLQAYTHGACVLQRRTKTKTTPASYSSSCTTYTVHLFFTWDFDIVTSSRMYCMHVSWLDVIRVKVSFTQPCIHGSSSCWRAYADQKIPRQARARKLQVCSVHYNKTTVQCGRSRDS